MRAALTIDDVTRKKSENMRPIAYTSVLRCAVAVLSLLSIFLGSAAGCASSSEDERYRVLRKTDSDGKQLVVALGDNAKLFCHTSVPWKKCIWKPPRNGVKEVRKVGRLGCVNPCLERILWAQTTT